MQRLKISHVQPSKGAEKAGVIPGDVIETFNGNTITSNDDLSQALQGTSGGALVVFRDKHFLTLNVTQVPLGITAVAFDFNPDEYDPNYSAEDVRMMKRRREVESVLVTTTPSVDGYRVARTIDVVSAECVFGMNIFSDIFAAFSDFFGGRSGVSQNALRKARQTCIYEIKAEAHQLGANAVIGIDLDYSEFSGQGKSMLFLVATGTAVVLEKIDGITNG